MLAVVGEQAGGLLVQAHHRSLLDGTVVGGEVHTVTLGKLCQLHRAAGLSQQVQALDDHAIEEQQILFTHVAQGLNEHLSVYNGLPRAHARQFMPLATTPLRRGSRGDDRTDTIELGFREIKQTLQEGEPVLRSKQPALVRQELWGVLIAYTLLRRWMREMAAHVQVEPQRISFHTASYAIVNLLAVPSLDSAGTLPKQLAALLAQSRHFVLPPRRTGRSFPRVVKKRASKFPTKKMPVSS